MDRAYVRVCYFALVVVRNPLNGKFLVVDESRGRGLWLPGGGVDDNESLVQGAIRETREEAGVDIRVEGLLRFEGGPLHCDRTGRHR
jgi:8-oxo-dGTP pyrophosphatase MutT (NUDIX family)